LEADQDENVITTNHQYKVIRVLLNGATSHDLDRSSRSLTDFQGHWTTASLFECAFEHSCAAVNRILTYARHCMVYNRWAS